MSPAAVSLAWPPPSSGPAPSAAPPLSSGPILRTFFGIVRCWHLDRARAMALLDLRVNATYANWSRQPDSARLREGTLVRAGHVFAIHAALRTLLAQRAVADSWVWHANREPLFGGRPPIELMTTGRLEDLAMTRRYLDDLVLGGPTRARRIGGERSREAQTVRLTWEGSVRLAPAPRSLELLFEDTAEPEDLDTVRTVLSIPCVDERRVDASDAAADAGREPVAAPPALAAASDGADLDAGSPSLAALLVGAAYRAAGDRVTAIAEACAQQLRFLTAADLPSTDVVLAAHVAGIDAVVQDLRAGADPAPPRGAEPAGAAPVDGVVYDSAESPDGQCVELYGGHGVRAPIRGDGRVIYRWDGDRRRIVEVFDEPA